MGISLENKIFSLNRREFWNCYAKIRRKGLCVALELQKVCDRLFYCKGG